MSRRGEWGKLQTAEKLIAQALTGHQTFGPQTFGPQTFGPQGSAEGLVIDSVGHA